jgi:hypothetical protein
MACLGKALDMDLQTVYISGTVTKHSKVLIDSQSKGTFHSSQGHFLFSGDHSKGLQGTLYSREHCSWVSPGENYSTRFETETK